jgi:hypothetical protein
MNKETKIQNAILLALSEAGCLVWRVETAGAWVGKVIHRERDTVTLTNARMFTTGLCKGGADIIGITPGGLFLAVEVKTDKGKVTLEQTQFISAVREAGGIACVARSPEEALFYIP